MSSCLFSALIVINGTKQSLDVEEFDSRVGVGTFPKLWKAVMSELNAPKKVRTLDFFWS